MTYEVVSNYKYADRDAAEQLVWRIRQNMGNRFYVRAVEDTWPVEETWRDYFWWTSVAQDGR